jgi:hypothetical protein
MSNDNSGNERLNKSNEKYSWESPGSWIKSGLEDKVGVLEQVDEKKDKEVQM